MIKLVVLDFDDTLCFTEEAAFHYENDIAKDMGFGPMSRASHKKNWGIPLKDAISDRIPGIDVKEFMRRHDKWFLETVMRGALDPINDENIEVLDRLKKSGRKLAILTARTLPEVRHLLHESNPISASIEKIYHKDNSEYHKPDPRTFGPVLKHFKASPSETVYIGDATTDAQAAKKAGLHFIAVLEAGTRTKEDFKGLGVDHFVDKFTDILPYILKK